MLDLLVKKYEDYKDQIEVKKGSYMTLPFEFQLKHKKSYFLMLDLKISV